MKLDTRIIEGKRPLTCFDADKAEQFLGKKGYFSDYLNVYTNISNMKEDVLQSLDEHHDKHHDETYIASRTKWKFFLPAEWVKEEEPECKWRPFTLDDFVKRFDLEVGTRVFLLRSKRTPENQKRLLLTGIIQDKDPALCGIGLGPYFFKFSELFLFHEVKIGEKDWHPFGVEEASE